MIKLLVKFAEESRELEFADGAITIGRSSENLIALSDKKASRKHAKIEKVDAQYRLIDLESGNGTKVNGQETRTHVLAKGDEIRIGLSTIYVLDLDTPAAAAPAPAPAAVPAEAPVAAVAAPAPAAVAAPAAPAPAPAAPAAEEAAAEPKRRHTRRAFAHRSSSGGKLVAVAAVLIIVGAVGYALAFHGTEILPAKKNLPSSAGLSKRKAAPTLAEAEAAYKDLSAKAQTGEVTDALVTEAAVAAERYADLLPKFETLASDLREKLSDRIAKMTFAEVDILVQAAMREKRYGAAIDALKALKASPDAAAAAAKLQEVTQKIRDEFKAVDEAGKKLEAEHKYTAAADHYRDVAGQFRGTEHYKYLSNKPETLMMLAEAELAAAKAKEERPAAPAPKPEPVVAKVEPPKDAAKPVMEPPKPKPEMKPEPKPAMEAPKPKPEMKPEPPKPKPPEPPKPPPPPPPAPKPEPKPEAAGDKPRPAFKKPDVLCDVKRTVKGMYCVGCARELTVDDVRRNVCKRCEEKPKKIDLCVKRYFQAECHPEKVSDKPVFC
jgi:hypothetical protein